MIPSRTKCYGETIQGGPLLNTKDPKSENSLHEAMEDMFQNITISFLSSDLLQQVTLCIQANFFIFISYCFKS